jgi:hypothetical protein
LDLSFVLVMVLDSAIHDLKALESTASSVRIVGASSPAQARAALSKGGGQRFEFAIVVAPAPQAGPDGVSLAETADVAVLVARAGRTRFGEAQLAGKLLRQVGLPTAAAMLVTAHAQRRK